MRELGNFPADIKIAQVTGQNHKECEDIIYTCSSQGMEFMGIADGQSKKNIVEKELWPV